MLWYIYSLRRGIIASVSFMKWTISKTARKSLNCDRIFGHISIVISYFATELQPKYSVANMRREERFAIEFWSQILICDRPSRNWDSKSYDHILVVRSQKFGAKNLGLKIATEFSVANSSQLLFLFSFFFWPSPFCISYTKQGHCIWLKKIWGNTNNATNLLSINTHQ